MSDCVRGLLSNWQTTEWRLFWSLARQAHPPQTPPQA